MLIVIDESVLWCCVSWPDLCAGDYTENCWPPQPTPQRPQMKRCSLATVDRTPMQEQSRDSHVCCYICKCLTTPQTQTSQAKFREGWAQYLTTNWSPLEDELTLFISRRKAWTWMSPVSVIGKMEGGTFRNTGLVATEQIPTSVTVTVLLWKNS